MMRSCSILRILLLLLLLTATLLHSSALPALSASRLEQAILQEMNAARTNPSVFVDHLKRHRALFAGKRYRPPGANYSVITQEGTAAVDEAIAFLKKQSPVPPLVWSEPLARLASKLARAQAKSGETGHGRGKLGMEARIGRQMNWLGTIGENISYGPDEGREAVMLLIVDDGVPGRGHRANIFSAAFRLAGVACGPHPAHGTVCVIDFAGGNAKGREHKPNGIFSRR